MTASLPPSPREAVGKAFDPALMLRARERSWEALRGVRERMRPGISEDEARVEAAEVFRALGMERLWHPVVIRIGENTTKTFREPSHPDVRLGEDDIYFIDLGLVFDGHEGDVGDTFTTGSDPGKRACAEAARWLVYHVAWLKQQGKSATLDAAIAKLSVSESFVQSCLDAVQIHGGYGYMTDFGIERDLRDSISGTLYSGTSEIQRNIIAAMLGLSKLE